MSSPRFLAPYSGRFVIVGLGSVAQGLLPVLLEAFALQPSQVQVVSDNAGGSEVTQALGVPLLVQPLTPANYDRVLDPLVRPGDFLLNLAVDVSSHALVEYCARRGLFYIDACIEPWAGRYDNPGLPATERSNYALREEMLSFHRDHRQAPTACVTQGANPGLVSTFAKVAMLRMAADLGLDADPPTDREGWARLAQRLQVKVIHVAERDTQASARRRQRGEFVNTWSVEAFVDEGLQPAELGWGTHEKHWPADALRHGYGTGAAIMLDRPGLATRVRSWTPLQGAYHGFLVTHGESISLADYLTVRAGREVVYRPTVHYAYHPCDDAVASIHEFAGRNWRLQPAKRILRDEIESGMDELGVLLMGNPRGVYWYGSRLTVQEARRIAPYNNATSLQVVAGLLGPIAWALRHPRLGVVEPEQLDHDFVMQAAQPYLGELAGVWGDWTPLQDRDTTLFTESRDLDDPWQFLNFRVT